MSPLGRKKRREVESYENGEEMAGCSMLRPEVLWRILLMWETESVLGMGRSEIRRLKTCLIRVQKPSLSEYECSMSQISFALAITLSLTAHKVFYPPPSSVFPYQVECSSFTFQQPSRFPERISMSPRIVIPRVSL